MAITLLFYSAVSGRQRLTSEKKTPAYQQAGFPTKSMSGQARLESHFIARSLYYPKEGSAGRRDSRGRYLQCAASGQSKLK